MKIKLQVPVKIDGIDFKPGTYDESEIPAGNIESLIMAKWARKVSGSEAEDDDEDESPKPPVAPKPSRKR
jgi:hypothetical protein